MAITFQEAGSKKASSLKKCPVLLLHELCQDACSPHAAEKQTKYAGFTLSTHEKARKYWTERQ